MKKEMLTLLKWGAALGLALYAATQIVGAQRALPAPAPPYGGGAGGPEVQPFCDAFPHDPLCTSFGGPGQAWI